MNDVFESFDLIIDLFRDAIEEKKINIAASEKSLELLEQSVKNMRERMQGNSEASPLFTVRPDLASESTLVTEDPKPSQFVKDESQQ